MYGKIQNRLDATYKEVSVRFLEIMGHLGKLLLELISKGLMMAIPIIKIQRCMMLIMVIRLISSRCKTKQTRW